ARLVAAPLCSVRQPALGARLPALLSTGAAASRSGRGAVEGGRGGLCHPPPGEGAARPRGEGRETRASRQDLVPWATRDAGSIRPGEAQPLRAPRHGGGAFPAVRPSRPVHTR